MNKLTVIVPVYNGEKSIRLCIDSLLGVTEPIDILIINDGSTDKTVEVLSPYLDSHSNIRLLSKENEGIAAARNYALDHIETPYFAFLDSDDTVENDIYAKMLQKIEQESSNICFADFLWEYDDGTTRLGKDTGYKDRHEILEKMYATLWNKVYRTSWVKASGIRFPNGLVYEDASFLYRLTLSMDKVSYAEGLSVHYQQHVGSITHTFNLKINDMIQVFKGIYDHYKNNGAFEEYKDELEYLTIRFFLGSSYLRACRINDKKLRKETLEKGYDFLIGQFPEYRKNRYLKNGGKKNLYFSHTNRFIYMNSVPLFRLLYIMKILK